VDLVLLLAPARTPAPVVAKLSAEVRRILAEPEVRARLVGIDPAPSGPEEFAAFLAEEMRRWGELIRAAGIRAD
jgi:tripartite-type tricarboxylate transporter receptor subunit TctC